MPSTASFPMAMRWLSCSLLAIAACTPRTYVPPQGAERIDENELRQQADAIIRAECPRLLAGRPGASEEATFALVVAASGDVQGVTLAESFADSTLDDRIGELLARAHFDPAVQKAGGMRVRSGYSCGGGVATSTFEFLDR